MEHIKNLLEERKTYLLKLKKKKEKALNNTPEGSLRLCSSGNRTQYYHRKNPKDSSGIYICQKDIQLARKLAQKDYDHKVLRAAEKELCAIGRYLKTYPAFNAEEIYESLHKDRRTLISPIIETDTQLIQRWNAVTYQSKEFYGETPEFYTARGERVRSKSELIIADLLCKEGVPYRYEYPVSLKGMGKIYPDFCVLNVNRRKEWYWEHLGMMDDPAYAEKALQKIASYEQNGIFPGESLILTYETRKNPINQKIVMLMIQRYLK